jgi:hypothetical protein
MNVLTQLLIFVVVTVVKSHDGARRQGYRFGLGSACGREDWWRAQGDWKRYSKRKRDVIKIEKSIVQRKKREYNDVEVRYSGAQYGWQAWRFALFVHQHSNRHASFELGPTLNTPIHDPECEQTFSYDKTELP